MSKQRRLLEEEDEDDVMLPKREYDTFIFIFHMTGGITRFLNRKAKKTSYTQKEVTSFFIFNLFLFLF